MDGAESKNIIENPKHSERLGGITVSLPHSLYLTNAQSICQSMRRCHYMKSMQTSLLLDLRDWVRTRERDDDTDLV